MASEHLRLEVLARWLAGELPHDEVLRDVVPHFMARCPTCRRREEEIRRLQLKVGHWSEVVAVFEGKEAPGQLAILEQLPLDEQIRRVHEEEEFQNWGLCQLLLTTALEVTHINPVRAVGNAELGLEIARRLTEEAYHPEWVIDLQLRAWAVLGNARRVLGELWSADAAFREARRLFERSTGNPRIEAEVFRLEGSLRRAQRRFVEARDLTERALGLSREANDQAGVATAMLKRAKISEESGDVERAIEELGAAEMEIASVDDPRLLAFVRLNRLHALHLVGRYAEARQLAADVEPLIERWGDSLDRLRLRWTLAKIAHGLGEREQAELELRWVRTEFFEHHMAYDAALVSLDLAVLLAQDGRTAEIKTIAQEVLPLFESREVHREALVALLLFQRASEEERLTAQLAQHVANFLRRERRFGGCLDP